MKAMGKKMTLIVPVTKMREFLEVEEVANRTKEIVEYELPDISAFGEATFHGRV